VPALAQVGRAQQDPAAQYVHATVLPAEVATGTWPGCCGGRGRGSGRPGSPHPAGRARDG
jgi:hypothetical protein